MKTWNSPIAQAIFLFLIATASQAAAQGSTSGSGEPAGAQAVTSAAEQPATPSAPASLAAAANSTAPVAASAPQPGTISGTVLDVNGDLVPGATIEISAFLQEDHRAVVANDSAAFQIGDLKPGVAYSISVSAKGFVDWCSASIVLEPGQYFFVTDIHLKLASETTSVTVYANSNQIATEQVRLEEQQNIFGFIPNYYVAYDSQNAAPMTARLKFQLAMKSVTNPVTQVGVAFLAAADQAGDTPNYQQGWSGYGQRFGAIEADGFSNILIGGALLPSVLHQDPRYFYQGTGSTRSRLLHALSAPLITRGDNGRNQINFSSLGGDMASSALSTTYYPASNRGAGMVFGTFALSTGERAINAVLQEFVLPRFTTRARAKSMQP
jgi:hypothetical protein